MHWIIQDNLYNEVGHSDLISTLERFDIPHSVVKVIPFTNGLPINERIMPVPDVDGPVMVCGSISLGNVAKQAGWFPGSFHNENHDFRVWKEHYGEHLLNYHAKTCRFADVSNEWSEFFIRPCEDTKSFSGKMYDWEEFDTWRNRVIDLHETYTTLDADTMVMYGPAKNIYREVRFFVVDAKIATASTYKIGNKITYSTEIPPTTTEYAQRMIDLWQPARAFVIDIALTDDADDGYNKIVEIKRALCIQNY